MFIFVNSCYFLWMCKKTSSVVNLIYSGQQVLSNILYMHILYILRIQDEVVEGWKRATNLTCKWASFQNWLFFATYNKQLLRDPSMQRYLKKRLDCSRMGNMIEQLVQNKSSLLLKIFWNRHKHYNYLPRILKQKVFTKVIKNGKLED